MDNKSEDSREIFHEDLDQYAEIYINAPPEHRAEFIYKQKLIDRVVPSLEGPKVLEMGAGVGDWTREIINKFGSSYIVEGSARLAEKAEETYGGRATVFNEFFENFRPPVQFNSIVCSLVLEHVFDPVVCLRRAKEWLVPGGLLFACVPHADSLHRRLGVIMGINKDTNELGPSDHSVGHRRVYRASEFERDLKLAGFEEIDNISMGLKVLPSAAMIHLSDEQIGGMFDLGDHLDVSQRCTLAYFARRP